MGCFCSNFSVTQTFSRWPITEPKVPAAIAVEVHFLHDGVHFLRRVPWWLLGIRTAVKPGFLLSCLESKNKVSNDPSPLLQVKRLRFFMLDLDSLLWVPFVAPPFCDAQALDLHHIAHQGVPAQQFHELLTKRWDVFSGPVFGASNESFSVFFR